MPTDDSRRIIDALSDTIGDFASVDLRRPSAPPTFEPHAGTDRYVEGEVLGKGGLGVVVEAFDTDLRRTVALKRPRADRMSPDSVADLVREAQIAAQLEHPNVPAVHGLGIDGEGRPYFTMTLLDGTSLGELLDARRVDQELARELTNARLLRIFIQAAYAVAFAHDRGVVHRDLKPDNIMLGAFGEVRVIDWGLAMLVDVPDPPADIPRAKQVEVSTGDSDPNAVVGTLGYAAPEQLAGSEAIDARADVYALGATLYEMVTGRPPVTGTTPMAFITATLNGDIIPVTKLSPIDERLAAVITKALATDRAHRYEHVMAMVRDVEAVLEGRPVSALDEDVITRARKVYFGRPPRIARLKAVDVDTLCWGSMLGGAAIGVSAGALGWMGDGVIASLVLGILAVFVCIPGIYTMVRKPRPDDPGVVVTYSGGVDSSDSLVSRVRRTSSEPPSDDDSR